MAYMPHIFSKANSQQLLINLILIPYIIEIETNMRWLFNVVAIAKLRIVIVNTKHLQ